MFKSAYDPQHKDRAVIVRRVISRLTVALGWILAARTSSAAFAHTLFARLFLVGINFATGILVARTLEAHGRGVQAAVSIWPVVLCGLFTFGIPSALRFRIPREPNKAADYLSCALVFAIALGFAGMLVGVFLVPLWLARYDMPSIRFAQWMLLFIPGSIGLYMIGAFFEATARFRQSNALIYAPPATTLGALILLALLHKMTPFTSTLSYYIPTNVVFLIRLWSLRDSVRFPPPRFQSYALRLASYGARAFGIDILATLSSQVDQALVVRFLSASQLGIYAVALAVSRLLSHFSTSLTTILLPKAAAMPQPEAVALVARSARVTLGMTALGALVLGSVTPVIVPLFYGRDFAEAGRLSQILYVEVTISATISVLIQAFLSTGRPGVVTALQGIGLAAVVPLMLFSIPRYGLVGAAAALLASTMLRLVLVLISFPVLLKVSPPNIFPMMNDVRFAIGRFRSRSA